MLIFPVWPLIRRSCMSKLKVYITFAPIINLSHFVFDPEQLDLLPTGIYNYLEFCHQSLLFKAHYENYLEHHHSFT